MMALLTTICGLDWWLYSLVNKINQQPINNSIQIDESITTVNVIKSDFAHTSTTNNPPLLKSEIDSLNTVTGNSGDTSWDCLQNQRILWQQTIQTIQAILPYLCSGRLHQLTINENSGSCSGVVSSWNELRLLTHYLGARLTNFKLVNNHFENRKIFFTSSWGIKR